MIDGYLLNHKERKARREIGRKKTTLMQSLRTLHSLRLEKND